MGVIITRSPWTRQPSSPTGLAAEWRDGNLFALAGGLSGISLLDIGKGTLLSPVNTGNLSSVATPYGVGVNLSSTTGPGRWVANSPNGKAYTLVSVMSGMAVQSNYQGLIDDDTGSGLQRNFQFRINPSGQLEFIRFDTSDNPFTATSGTIPSSALSGLFIAIGRSYASGAVSCFASGATSGSATITGTPQSSVTGTVQLGGIKFDTANYYPLGTRLFSGSWNYAFTDAQVAKLLANPWQLFAPLPRRIWVPSAVSGGGTVALTGSAVTASSGTLTPSVSIPLSGQAATASAGTIAPARSVPVSGQAATASAGTLTPSVSIPLSGQAATASAGTVSPTVTIALTGTAVTASAGTVTYSAGNNISLTLTGTEVTASAGNLGLSSTVPVSGSSAAASAGTLTTGTSVAVSGTAVTASAGTVTYSANQDLTLALSGEAVQVSAGTITVIGGVSAVAVTGGAPGPRQQRWVVYINGKRYIGSLQEIEQIVAEFAENQAEKAQTAKPPKKPKIKVEAGRPVGVKPSETVKVQPEPEVQQQVRNIYAEAYARAIAQMELDEEEDIISLL